jgi:hypothetical protein
VNKKGPDLSGLQAELVEPDTRSRRKRCQPFLYDSPGTLERGTQWYFLVLAGTSVTAGHNLLVGASDIQVDTLYER